MKTIKTRLCIVFFSFHGDVFLLPIKHENETQLKLLKNVLDTFSKGVVFVTEKQREKHGKKTFSISAFFVF